MASRKKSSTRDLQIKAKKVIRAKLEGKSNEDACLEAGYSKSTARGKGSEIVNRLKPDILAMMEKNGLTDEYLMRKLKAELVAKETKFFQFQGEVIESKDVIAWEIRQRARMDAHKLRGDYPSEKHDLTVRSVEDVLRDIEAGK